MCCCAIGCQHSTLNRLFGCVFLVWCHYLRKVNKSSVHPFKRFFSTIFIFFDVPWYSNRTDYIKDIRPAIYFHNQKNHSISSLRISLEQSFTAWTPLLMATSAYELRRKWQSSPPYLHCVHTITTDHQPPAHNCSLLQACIQQLNNSTVNVP